MKATTIIIAAVFSLQVSILFAGNNEAKPSPNNETVSFTLISLAPVTPIEATFDGEPETIGFKIDFSMLAPEIPLEADFYDVVPEKNLDITILAPVTPAEADFYEIIEDQPDILNALAPVTPAEADFE